MIMTDEFKKDIETRTGKKVVVLQFTDAQQMHKAHPETFAAPTLEELVALTKGDTVKVCITAGDLGERIWVKVELVIPSKQNVLYDRIIGTLANDPVCFPASWGDPISFEARHIYQINF